MAWLGSIVMKHTDDREYYAVRILEEMERGDLAPNAAVARVHYEMARRYTILAARSGLVTPQPTPDLVPMGQLAA